VHLQRPLSFGVLLSLALPSTVHAQARHRPVPQFNASILAGLRAFGSDATEPYARGVVGLRPELILGRRTERTWGTGPYMEVGWLGVSNVSIGSGWTLSIPLTAKLALAPSVGIFGHEATPGFRGGYVAGLFFGHRMFNDISFFDATAGIRADWRSDFESGGQRAVVLTAQLDLTGLVAVGAFL
jgi:hypothetical protein